MTQFRRIRISKTGEVSVSAAEYWSALRDWGALMEWMPKESPPMPIRSCELKAGHSATRLPCTRVLHVDMSKLPAGSEAVVPSTLQETVIHADDTARFLYYTLDGPLPFGLRNYFAYTEVDEIGPDRARVTNTGRGDIAEQESPEALVSLMEDTYERAIIRGIGEYALRKRNAGPKP